MVQMVPLPPTVSCFSNIQIGFTFLVLAHSGNPGQRAVEEVLLLLFELSCGSLDAVVVTLHIHIFLYILCKSHII